MKQSERSGFAEAAALPLGLLLGAVSLAGVAWPAVYARETVSWAAQGAGQDWVNLLMVSPLLLLAGALSWRGSAAARQALGGLYAYTLYSFVIYALAMHFNVLFLGYCGVLGLSFFAMTFLLRDLARDVQANHPAPPDRLAGGFLVALAVLMAGLWLAEDLPAVASGTAPPSLAAVGLVTHPVHVLDLSVALPAMALTGIALLRQRALGQVLGPVMLGLATWMSIAIVGMTASLDHRGLGLAVAPLLLFGIVAVVSFGLLVRMLRRSLA